ncbi:MAG: ORF6C domain-containing protein [Clostridium sp.]
MDQLKVFDFKGQNVIESRMVAEMIEMRHSHLLEKIKGYEDVLANRKLGSLDLFIPSTYKDAQNKERPCYLLTKQGCEMVANKLTGPKGIVFSAEYVRAFNEMEELAKTKELVSLEELSKHPLKVLELMFNANKHTDKKIDEVNEDLQYFKKDMPLLPVECDDIQKAVRQLGTRLLGGHGSPAYYDRSIRQSVYADIGREIKHKFNVRSYKAIKRKYLDDVNRIIEHYECPIELLELIKEKNRAEQS